MPVIVPLAQDQFEERRGVHGEVLVWLTARNRSSGLPETIGLWSGDDHQDFVINGQTRTYYGAGNVIDVPPIRSMVGLKTVYHTITLPPVTDEVRQALVQYDANKAPVEVHVVPVDVDTGNALAEPIRMIKGTLQEAPEVLGEKGARSDNTKLKVASSARRLSLGVPFLKSDEALKAVAPTDEGRAYIDVAGDWDVPWGEA